MLTRYRMDVVCASVPEAIACAGGLLFDRSLSGWDVSVYATDDATTAEQHLALRILGAAHAGNRPAEPADQPLLRAVVLSGDLYRTDEDVRRWADTAMGEPRIEVLVWDTGLRASDGRQVEIPVSQAAAAFRGQALAIAGCDAMSRPSEFYRQLRTGRVRRPMPRQTELTTVNGL
jgi:hypothetical protein